MWVIQTNRIALHCLYSVFSYVCAVHCAIIITLRWQFLCVFCSFSFDIYNVVVVVVKKLVCRMFVYVWLMCWLSFFYVRFQFVKSNWKSLLAHSLCVCVHIYTYVISSISAKVICSVCDLAFGSLSCHLNISRFFLAFFFGNWLRLIYTIKSYHQTEWIPTI